MRTVTANQKLFPIMEHAECIEIKIGNNSQALVTQYIHISSNITESLITSKSEWLEFQ